MICQCNTCSIYHHSNKIYCSDEARQQTDEILSNATDALDTNCTKKLSKINDTELSDFMKF